MFQRPDKSDIETNTVVIGAGVAGITIAKALHSREVDFWLLGSPFESQLAKTSNIEESELFPGKTTGLKYMEKQNEELQQSDISHKTSKCIGIEELDNKYLVKTKYQNFITERIIIATGAKQGKLGFKGEQEFFRSGVSDCAVCDFPLFRNKPLAVIGNHKYTRKSAEFLSQKTKQVYLLWYEDDNPPKIGGVKTFSNVRNVEVSGDDTVEKVSFDSNQGLQELKISAIFVEGEPVPATDFLNNFDIDIKDGYIIVNDNYLTSKENIWAVGDVTGKTTTYDEVYRTTLEFLKSYE